MGEFAFGGIVAVAVGFDDRRYLLLLIFLVLVLLSAHVHRFSVSCMLAYFLADELSLPPILSINQSKADQIFVDTEPAFAPARGQT